MKNVLFVWEFLRAMNRPKYSEEKRRKVGQKF
jgi:hypothetical protein